MLSVDDVNAILRLPLLGVIADEPGVIVATNKGEPIALDPGLARPAKRIARLRAGSWERTRRRRKSRAKHPSSANCSGASAKPCSSFSSGSSIRNRRASPRANGLRLVLLSDHLALAPDVVESLKADSDRGDLEVRRRRRRALRRDVRAAGERRRDAGEHPDPRDEAGRARRTAPGAAAGTAAADDRSVARVGQPSTSNAKRPQPSLPRRRAGARRAETAPPAPPARGRERRARSLSGASLVHTI
jgi:hypothetical protein